jgi:hypothetical protein
MWMKFQSLGGVSVKIINCKIQLQIHLLINAGQTKHGCIETKTQLGILV